ncbi:hypothetical protein D8674_027792 [Pyrus ussuriensis x Pyrus communis]|uniref:Uncharacterized protein n=1 Tax=Pyrus ussuriensis x Pyrus communis TaxID=2448454 RepID=A0A5N5IBS4_9ROSA|nr:hypothetical protein D8674_027792 [Pyrus ussuriensis x Pyrus communis]
MEADEVMELYDSFWFELQIIKKQPISPIPSRIEENADHEIEENPEKPSKPEFLRIPTGHTRSMSDELSSKTTFNLSSLSPDSVLDRPKLSTVLSGKEAGEIENQKQIGAEEETPKKVERRRRKKKSESKSLTDLQFEELKGFMDLGFVFSEEDKDSNLVSIIPGLQRLGKKDDSRYESFDASAISRPYLSEAWKVREKRKRGKPLMNWRFPALENEIDMKDNLKWWAHTVASAVR